MTYFSLKSSYCLELLAVPAYVILYISVVSRQTNLVGVSYSNIWVTSPQCAGFFSFAGSVYFVSHKQTILTSYNVVLLTQQWTLLSHFLSFTIKKIEFVKSILSTLSFVFGKPKLILVSISASWLDHLHRGIIHTLFY